MGRGDLAGSLRGLLAKYALLLDLLRGLGREDLPAEEIRGAAAKMAALQAEALRHGEVLKAAGPMDLGPEEIGLVEELQARLAEIVQENRLLLPRIQGMMALAAAELSDLQKGKAAMSGYASGSPEKGTRLSGSF